MLFILKDAAPVVKIGEHKTFTIATSRVGPQLIGNGPCVIEGKCGYLLAF